MAHRLVDKYLPDTIFEMKSFQHITPLETMNFCTTLVNILEGMLKPENLNSKATQEAFETYFVLACVWAFGGGTAPKDGIDYRRNFDKWWKKKWTTIKFPNKGSVSTTTSTQRREHSPRGLTWYRTWHMTLNSPQ